MKKPVEELAKEARVELTPEIYKFAQLLNDARLKDWENATYWYYDKDGKLYSSNEVKLRISSTDNSLHFGAVPQHVQDLHGLLPLSIKRPWVGLTDEERKPLIQQAMMYYGYNKEYWLQTSGAGFCLLVQAIEAKLKEKNNGT